MITYFTLLYYFWRSGTHFDHSNVVEVGLSNAGKALNSKLKVVHQACVGLWVLWYRSLSKEMRYAHILPIRHTTGVHSPSVTGMRRRAE